MELKLIEILLAVITCTNIGIYGLLYVVIKKIDNKGETPIVAPLRKQEVLAHFNLGGDE